MDPSQDPPNASLQIPDAFFHSGSSVRDIDSHPDVVQVDPVTMRLLVERLPPASSQILMSLSKFMSSLQGLGVRLAVSGIEMTGIRERD